MEAEVGFENEVVSGDACELAMPDCFRTMDEPPILTLFVSDPEKMKEKIKNAKKR